MSSCYTSMKEQLNPAPGLVPIVLANPSLTLMIDVYQFPL
ncbi:hypothetical protein ACU8KH_05165 [Lachancea thermotolerans]